VINELSIRNYQSLYHVDMELAQFTVIVGRSSSGKSAFTRALKMLTSNQRGTLFISHGEKTTTVTARTDRGTVTLKRGKGTSDNEYIVIPEGQPEQQRAYTKLGGETPPEVSQFLGIAAKDPINYAGQFDKPYLLGEGAGEVARVLGRLTNVSVIFEAAAESNRRKLKASASLKVRAEDMAAIMAKVSTYKNLKGQLASLTAAEEAVEQARVIQQQIKRLETIRDQQTMAQTTIDRWSPTLDLPVPDTQQIIETHEQLTRLQQIISAMRAARTALTTAQDQALTAETEVVMLEDDYQQTLHTAGVCPTCGATT
jgi:DNA repair ATPase RecN